MRMIGSLGGVLTIVQYRLRGLNDALDLRLGLEKDGDAVSLYRVASQSGQGWAT